MAWAGAGAPGGAPSTAPGTGVEGDGAPDAAHQVHVVDEHGDGLEHVEEAPLELADDATTGSLAAPEQK